MPAKGQRIRVERTSKSPSFRREWVLETASFTELVDSIKNLLREQGYTAGSKSLRHRGLAAKVYGVKRLGEDTRTRPLLVFTATLALLEALITLSPLFSLLDPKEAYRLLQMNPFSLNGLLASLLGLQGDNKTWFLLFLPVALIVLWAPLHGRGGWARHLEDLLIGVSLLGLMNWARHYSLIVQESLIGFYAAGVVELLASIALFSLAREKIYYSSLVEVDLIETGEIDWWKKVRKITVKLRATLASMELAGSTIRVKPVEAPFSEEDLRVLPEKTVKPVLYRIGEKREKKTKEELIVDLFSLVKNEFNKLQTLIEPLIEDYSAENQPQSQDTSRGHQAG